MDRQIKRQIVHGMLSLIIGILVARLIDYLTDRIVGDDPKELTD